MGMHGAASIVRPRGFRVCLLVFGLSSACTFQVHPGIQSKIKSPQPSPPTSQGSLRLPLSQARVAARSAAEAVTCLGQKALQGPVIPTLHQNNSSHLGTAATGIFTTKPRWLQSVRFVWPARPGAPSPRSKPSQSISSCLASERKVRTHVHFNIARETAMGKSATKTTNLFIRDQRARLPSRALMIHSRV